MRRYSPNASVGLDTTEASGAAGADRCVVDVAAWDNEGLATNGNVEVWQGGAAWVGVATLLAVVLGALNLRVVGGDDGSWQVQERSTSVSDGRADAAGGGVAGANGVATGGELPEALCVVHWDVGDAAGVLGAVDIAAVM